MLVAHDDGGFYASDAATHDIPDVEWSAYRKLVDLANEMEDRFVLDYVIDVVGEDYVIDVVDEYAHLRGVLSDAEIAVIAAGRSGSPAPAAVGRPDRRPLSPAQVIAAARNKCHHKHQSQPDQQGNIRCQECGVIIIGHTGVAADIHSQGLRPYAVAPAKKVDRNGFPDYGA